MKTKGLEQWLTSPIKSGDTFYLKGDDNKYNALGAYGVNMVCSTEKNKDLRTQINIENPKIYKKEEDFEGVNPFGDSTIRFSAFGIESILSMIGFERRTLTTKDGDGIPYFNWNPYFIIKGEQVYYQRGYVWTLEQKQALITTMYKNLEAGRVIVAKHDFHEVEAMVKKGYKDYACRDIVDGKQRLSTIIEFISDKFADEDGNYHSDLSDNAQRKLMQYSGIMFGEMDEGCSPSQICDAFLNNAVAGTPISKEHIEFIKQTKKDLLGE